MQRRPHELPSLYPLRRKEQGLEMRENLKLLLGGARGFAKTTVECGFIRANPATGTTRVERVSWSSSLTVRVVYLAVQKR